MSEYLFTHSLEFSKLLFFGDSITQYMFKDEAALGRRVANDYSRKLDILQRGFSGYNTAQAVEILPRLLAIEKSKIELAVIFFGTNDAATPEIPFQHVPLPAFQENLRRIVKTAREGGIERIILVSPGTHDEELWVSTMKKELPNLPKGFLNDLSHGLTASYRTNELNKKYRDVVEAVSQEMDTGFVDLYTAFTELSDHREALLDGIHYSAVGYTIYYERLMAEISRKYPEVSPEAVKMHLPDFRDVDKDDVVNTMFGTNA